MPGFLDTLFAGIAGSVGIPIGLSMSKSRKPLAIGFVSAPALVRRGPYRADENLAHSLMAFVSGTVEPPTDPVGILTVSDLPAFEFLVSEPVVISDLVVSLTVLDLSGPETPMGELLGASDPLGNLTCICLPASKTTLERELAGGSSPEEAGTVTGLITFGSLVSGSVALILPVLSLPMSIRPCSR